MHVTYAELVCRPKYKDGNEPHRYEFEDPADDPLAYLINTGTELKLRGQVYEAKTTPDFWDPVGVRVHLSTGGSVYWHGKTGSISVTNALGQKKGPYSVTMALIKGYKEQLIQDVLEAVEPIWTEAMYEKAQRIAEWEARQEDAEVGSA